MVVTKWTPDYIEGEDCPIVPVWVSCPKLPIYLHDQRALSLIGSSIGRPLKVDENTLNFSRPDLARFCVEVDVSKALPSKVHLKLGDKDSFISLIYENVPHYCTECKKLGHHKGSCKRDEQRKIVQEKESNSAPKLPNHSYKGKEPAKEEWTKVTARNGGVNKVWKRKMGPFQSGPGECSNTTPVEQNKQLQDKLHTAGTDPVPLHPQNTKDKDREGKNLALVLWKPLPTIEESIFTPLHSLDNNDSDSDDSEYEDLGVVSDLHWKDEAPLQTAKVEQKTIDQSIKSRLSSVYGMHSRAERIHLWDSLMEHNPEEQAWIVGGDFNTIVSLSELKEAETEALKAQEIFEREDTPANREASNLANANLLKICKQEESYWAQKSNIKWLAEGDISTKFFHSFVKGKRRKASIRFMKNQEGKEMVDHVELSTYIAKHFENTFTEEHSGNLDPIIQHIPTLITEHDNQVILQLPIEEEIKSAMWHLNPNSSAGPDGFNGEFFRYFWDTIKMDMVSAVQEFFLGIPLPMAFGSSLITLIPKTEGAKEIGDCRPIALSTFFSKIISRILSSRLAPLLDKIISPEQAGFLKGRVQDLPLSVINLIHSKLANFFWGSKFGKNKHHWAKWVSLCRPTGEGGLGIRSLFDIQRASALKLWWKAITGDTIWAQFVKNKYYRDGLFEAKVYDSASWKRICRIAPLGFQHSNMQDNDITWVNGTFTFKEAYWAVRERDISTQFNTLSWNKFQIPKVKLFTWKAVNHYLPFPKVLNKLSFNLPSKCNFCNKHEATDEHTLLSCDFSATIWNDFAEYSGGPKWRRGSSEQTRDAMWDRIEEKFFTAMNKDGSYRTRDKLTSKWSHINRKVQKFIGVYEECAPSQRSGTNNADVLRLAMTRTRRNTAASAQTTVTSDNPEQGMIDPVNGLETALNNVANMMANIMERLDKALPGPSGTRDIPAGQPRQVLRTASSPILQELHDPEEVERERQAVARRRAEELARNSKVNGDWAKAASQVVGNGNENPRGTVFERISRQKAHVSERLGKNPDKAPQGWIRPQASQVASSNREPWKRNGRGGSQAPVRSLVVLDEDEVQSQVSDALMCRCFLQTVDSKVADWVNHIPAGSIRTWDELGLRFLEHFARNCCPKKHFTHLASVRQKHGESLTNFLIQWRKESREVEGTDDKSRLAMFTAALQDGLLHTDLTTHPPDTFEEAMVRAGRYGTNPGTPKKHKSANPVFTLLVAEVMAHATQQGLMTYPTYSQKVCNVEDTGKWCAYHRKNDHNTKDCYTLKNEMARLIHRGHLKKFVQDGEAGNPGNAQNGKRRDKEVAQAEAREKRHIGLEDEEKDSEPAPNRQKRHHGCNFIIGGNTSGDSATSRKKWANATMVNKATKQPVKYDTQVGEVTAQLLRAEERRPRVEVVGDIEEVELEPGTPGRLVRIGKGLGSELRSRVISVLRRFMKVFAWSPDDMPGLDHRIAVHLLNVLRDAKPVKQKRRHLSQERRDFVKKEAHRIVVLTNEPLASLTRSPAASARMTKWAVFISQYNVEFRPRPSIKGQELADFQVECTAREMTRAQVGVQVEYDWWVMSIDGSSGSRSFGAGIVLITPENFRIYYAIRFQFHVSNNEAEYEALINGLKILGKLGVSRVQVFSDSRLVVGQITGEFEEKEERMKRYRDLSLEMLGRFEFKLEHIPRAQNAEADVLSKLSAESPEYISKLATVEELATPSLNRDEVFWVSADPLEWLDRTIINGIKKKLLSEGSKWVDELPRILWTYRTTPRRATGDTPFGLAYGFEARAPAEAVIPTRREIEYDPEVNEQNQAVEQNFVEERRDEARIRAENYRRQVKSYFDSRVKPRAFQVGDYVLRKREKSQPTKGGKVAKKYEGPYIIKAVVRPGLGLDFEGLYNLEFGKNSKQTSRAEA
ncbi:unnamed protein product [Cuscuta campestris]|uniref:RNase H type-1 domain-containing protein n=1 Tax=Cuscuta campestris TaxID=132261 RepID=A0A484M4Z2_9ASTE|nr:unnamed protein product [Cuscuta campestris]